MPIVRTDYRKQYSFSLDFKEENSLSLPNVVAGDTGNVFTIKLLDGGQPITLNWDDVRIRFIINNRDGQGTQDTEYDTDGSIDLSQIADGEFTVYVYSNMISNGLNTGCVELYTSLMEQWDTLVTTNDFTFVATNSPSEKANAFPSLIEAEKRYEALIEVLEHYVELFDPENCVHYTEQSPTSAEQAMARSNIDAAANTHSHGNITYDGHILGKNSYLVETDENGLIVAYRRLIVTDQDPYELTGLQEGDIILSYFNQVSPPAS